MLVCQQSEGAFQPLIFLPYFQEKLLIQTSSSSAFRQEECQLVGKEFIPKGIGNHNDA